MKDVAATTTASSATEIVRHVLAQHPKETISDPSLTPAGVMLLLYHKNGEYCILLNKRTDNVEHHKGEISFPGGKRDGEDATILETALRETYEEMGIQPEHVEVLGQVDDMPTSSRFLINTYVGTIPYPYEFHPSQVEVASVLEVPISVLMNQEHWRDEVRLTDGHFVNSPSYAYQGHLIFGATARILQRFLELLDTAPNKEVLWRRTQPQL